MMHYLGCVFYLLLLQTHRVRGYGPSDLALTVVAYFLVGLQEVEAGRGHVLLFSLFLVTAATVGVSLNHSFKGSGRLLFLPFMLAQIVPVIMLLDLGIGGFNGPVVMVAYSVALSIGLLKEQIAESGSEVSEAQDSTAEILRVIRDTRVDELGPSIGEVLNHQIPGWIRLSTGQKLPFVRYMGARFVAEDVPHGYVVIQPGLLYGGEAGEH